MAACAVACWALPSCGGSREAALKAPGSGAFPLRRCTELPLPLEAAPGWQQTRGCVVRYTQELSDPVQIAALGRDTVQRRYLVYVPGTPLTRAPVVLVFPGYSASAETAALYYTHARFETLADLHGFVVVYGNGLPDPPPSGSAQSSTREGGYLQGCLAPHGEEGIDVQYVRQIIDQLETELDLDRTRIYATGLSAGGGFALQLALEAPDLVAAIAPVVPLPFQPRGPWLHHCHPKPGLGDVSIALLAATHDPFIAYAPGASAEYPHMRYPGMEHTRDAWLQALGISGPPDVELLPDRVQGDSHQPHTGLHTSHIERQRYPSGPRGQELWYYKAIGMGHWWPNPEQSWSALWPRFGKTNQDIDFADHAWEFFRRHSKPPR